MKDDPVATCRVCGVPVEMKSLLSHEASCRRARVMEVVRADPQLAMQRLYEFAFGVCEPDIEAMTEEEVDAELREFGIDPDGLVDRIMGKVNEMFKEKKPS